MQRNEGAGTSEGAGSKQIEGIAAELENESVVMEGEDVSDVDPTGRKLHDMIGKETKTSRWQLRGLGKLGVSFSGISDAPSQDELFSREEECKRRTERALRAIKTAAYNVGGDDAYARVTAECKRAAGIKGRLSDVIRDHPNPIDAIKAFEQAAYRAMQRSKRQGELL